MVIPLVPPPKESETGKYYCSYESPVNLWTSWFMRADFPVLVFPTMVRMWQFLEGSLDMN
jgi:hypothetical protein